MHLVWLVASKKPPLYAALPLQLYGLWSVRRQDFCAADIMQHPAMQARSGAWREGRGAGAPTACF